MRTYFEFDPERMARFGQVEMSLTVRLEGICWQSQVVEKYGLCAGNGKKVLQTWSPVPEQLTRAPSGQCQTPLAFLGAACHSVPFTVLSSKCYSAGCLSNYQVKFSHVIHGKHKASQRAAGRERQI